MNDLANTARAQWLSASLNSQVVTSLVIAGVEPLNFIENNFRNTISLDIQALRNNVTAQQLRDDFEADIVLLLTDGNYTGVGGIVSEIGPDENDAYGIVQVANATSTITWIHETAHLFGARHQFLADDATGDAHGHDWNKGFWSFLSRYGSIMRTLASNRNRVLHFSNPNVSHKGKATGVSGTSYNTKTLNFNGHVLEDFRFTQSDLAVSIYGSGSANDGDALSFSSSISNGQSPYTYQWRVNTGTGYYTVGSSSSLNITMPTDKDLEITLNVSDGSGQTASDYHFVRNLFIDGGPCTVCPDSTLMDVSNAIDLETVENNLENNKLMLFPNPTSNKLTYILPESDQLTTLQIIDYSGKIIKRIEFSSVSSSNKVQSLNITNLKSGIYFLKINNVTGYEKSMKFIKQ